jgi:hypothetical protein
MLLFILYYCTARTTAARYSNDNISPVYSDKGTMTVSFGTRGSNTTVEDPEMTTAQQLLTFSFRSNADLGQLNRGMIARQKDLVGVARCHRCGTAKTTVKDRWPIDVRRHRLNGSAALL